MSTVGSSGKFPRKWDIGLWKQALMKNFWVDEKRNNAFFQIRKGHIYMHSFGRFHVSPTLLLYPPPGHLKSGHDPRSARQALQESHLSGRALGHPINNFWQSYLYTPRDNENLDITRGPLDKNFRRATKTMGHRAHHHQLLTEMCKVLRFYWSR